ncbi:hypothetical protein Sjap_016341 [Stephania japonica]|uniref:Uncharacterized protein n=1 Tax=Stephania japonica TaxID=461633 RepID=A0AAP0IKU0_9MAGN
MLDLSFLGVFLIFGNLYKIITAHCIYINPMKSIVFDEEKRGPDEIALKGC